MDVMPLRTGLASLLDRVRSLAGFGRDGARVDELATQQALRDSEERLRLVRRATGLGMYEIDWAERRRYWSPELRALLRVPDDLDINTDADLLERIIPEDMRAAFRDKMWASLDPDSSGDYEDEHRITRFDGSTRLDPVARQDLLRRGPRRHAHALDRPDRRHHRPQARRGGERAACLDGAVLERRDLLDRSGCIIRTWNGGAERLYGYAAAEAIGQPLTMICPETCATSMPDCTRRP
jgi:PAS domain-containing protein